MEIISSDTQELIQDAVTTRWLQPYELLTVLQQPAEFGLQPSIAPPTSPPESGQVFLYLRAAVRNFRRDGHDWIRRNPNTTRVREDHMKLKFAGEPVLSCYFTRLAENRDFQRRVYWLVSDPAYALVHYLDVSGNSAETSSNPSTEQPEPASTPGSYPNGGTSSHSLPSLEGALVDADVSSPYTNAQPLTGDDDASQSVPDFSMTDVSTPYILESLEQVDGMGGTAPGTNSVGSGGADLPRHGFGFGDTGGGALQGGALQGAGFNTGGTSNILGGWQGGDPNPGDGYYFDPHAAPSMGLSNHYNNNYDDGVEDRLHAALERGHNGLAVAPVFFLGDNNGAGLGVGDVPQFRPPVMIGDYSPEWDFVSGGSKILFVCDVAEGSATPSFAVFGSTYVEVEVVTDTVLRCHAPAHQAGNVPLCLVSNDRSTVLSNAVNFEYRQAPVINPYAGDAAALLMRDSIGRRLEFVSDTLGSFDSASGLGNFDPALAFSGFANTGAGGHGRGNQSKASAFLARAAKVLGKKKGKGKDREGGDGAELPAADQEQAWSDMVADLLARAAGEENADRLVMLLAFADLRGATLVHYIAASGMDHLISLLLAPLDAAQARRIVESEDIFGRRPLHWAVMANRMAAVAELVGHGAAVFVRDALGLMPLHYATELSNSELVEFLIPEGVDLADASHAPALKDVNPAAGGRTPSPMPSTTGDGLPSLSLARLLDRSVRAIQRRWRFYLSGKRKAAIKIQSAFRRMRGRRQETAGDRQRLAEAKEAAVRIQAAFRGHQTRRRIVAKSKIISCWRHFLVHKQRDRAEAAAAAAAAAGHGVDLNNSFGRDFDEEQFGRA